MERLKVLKLPTLKDRRLRGNMTEVFKLVHNCYDPQAAVMMNFNTSSITRGNMYKLQKCACHYNLRKFAFCNTNVNIWNSLPNEVVESNTINTFKNRLDKHCSNQEILFDFNVDLTGTGSQPVCI